MKMGGFNLPFFFVFIFISFAFQKGCCPTIGWPWSFAPLAAGRQDWVGKTAGSAFQARPDRERLLGTLGSSQCGPLGDPRSS